LRVAEPASGGDRVEENHFAVGARRPGVPAPDLLLPELLRPAGRELLDDAGSPPDPVALRAEPLRPVVGAGRGGPENRRERQGFDGHSPHRTDSESCRVLSRLAPRADDAPASMLMVCHRPTASGSTHPTRAFPARSAGLTVRLNRTRGCLRVTKTCARPTP